MIGTKTRRISNSSLGWIMVGPRVFKMMWDRELRNSSTASLDLGSAIHCKLLEPDTFDERFCIAPKPSKGMMAQFIKSVHEHKSLLLPGEDLTEEVYDSIRNAVGLKSPLTQVMTDYYKPKHDDYKLALEQSVGKTIITPEEWDIIVAVKQGCTDHKLARDLLFGYNHLEIHNEYTLEGTVAAKYMEIPSVAILDRLIVDHAEKKAFIVDLKTTSGSVFQFHESYHKYSYARQMAFYKAHVQQLYPDYDVTVLIVAVQTKFTTHTTDVAVYGIDEDEILRGELMYQPLLDKISWHMKHDIWDHPQEYHESNGVCQINQSQ